MPSIFKNNAAGIVAEARQQAAKNLLAAATLFAGQHQQRLGARTPATKPGKFPVTYVPPFSKKDEYPMKRTGHLQASVIWEPQSPAEVEKTLRVKVGYLANAFYGAILEIQMGRHGLKQTLKDMQGELAAIAGGADMSMGGSL